MGFQNHLKNERGAALVIGLMFLAILGLLGTTAVVLTTTDMQIGSNYKTSVQSFNAAQAGIDEARARLKGNAANPIVDGDPTNANWETYIGTDTLAQKLSGYATGDTITTSVHTFTDMDYAVQLRHALDAGGNVLYWGDSDGDGFSERNTTLGNNIYLATSYATAGGANQTLTVEITRVPPLSVTAALYVEGNTDVNAAKTLIDGNDKCGSGVNLPGVASTQGSGVSCAPAKTGGCDNVDGSPEIQYNTPDMDVQGIIDDYKAFANITHGGGTAPGINWGVPTNIATTPDCNVSNIVYVSSSLHLTAHATGCGILLVDGDLDATGGLEWYGLVIASGCISNYTGAGGNDGIAGAAISGGNCKTKVSGSTQLNYCSTAVEDAAQNLPLKVLSWKDYF